MIIVKETKDEITIRGHANYSDKEDIVCASVSAILYTTVNGILRLDREAIHYEDNGDIVTITKIKDDLYTKTLIMNMLSLLKELSIQYPKNIKMESEEY